MSREKKIFKRVLWAYGVFPLSAGWAWMLLAGVLHATVGFPLFGYWVSVGLMALISWLIGSFQFRWYVGKVATEEIDI
jgi:hypothetical protein